MKTLASTVTALIPTTSAPSRLAVLTPAVPTSLSLISPVITILEGPPRAKRAKISNRLSVKYGRHFGSTSPTPFEEEVLIGTALGPANPVNGPLVIEDRSSGVTDTRSGQIPALSRGDEEVGDDNTLVIAESDEKDPQVAQT